MATVIAIKEKTQSKTAMSKIMAYVVQDKKTLIERGGGGGGPDDDTQRYRLISGRNCCAETAFSEFMATKRRHGKESGVYFYQYVQSFKPEEKTTPEEAHQMGVELAEYFKGYEVLISSHFDADHRHNHLIVNSVSHETGLKLQFNGRDLIKFRALSDEICKARGLAVLEPYTRHDGRSLGAREYRAALRGDSWKFRLMSAIDQSLAASGTRAGFIGNMRRLGYTVNWRDHHKYITYETPDGKKCRDNRLHEEKYLKENMERQFDGRAGKRVEFGEAQTVEPCGKSVARISDKAQPVRHTAGDAGKPADAAHGHSAGAGGGERAARSAPYMGAHNGEALPDLEGHSPRHCGGCGEHQGHYPEGTEREPRGHAAEFSGARQDAAGSEAQMDGRGRGGPDDFISAVHSLEALLNANNREEHQKREREEREKERQERRKRHRAGLLRQKDERGMQR